MTKALRQGCCSQPLARRQDALDYNKLLQTRASALSTCVIKIETMPDAFESIADVGQSQQRVAKSSGLNVTAKAPHASTAQRGTGTVAHSRHAPR